MKDVKEPLTPKSKPAYRSGGSLTMGDRTDNGVQEMETCPVKDHSVTVLSKLQSSYKSGFLTDLTVQVEDREFKVHRVVVAACSDYFAAMFSHDMLEATKSTVSLSHLRARSVEALLGFTYTGQIDLCLDIVQDVLEAALFLQIPSAIEVCIEFLKRQLTLDNAKDLVSLTELYGISEIKKFYREFLLKNFFQFAETEQFLKLDSDTLIDLICDDGLRTKSEGELLNKVLIWYNHDVKQRKKVAHRVFGQIRYTADGWPLYFRALKVEPFISNYKCRALLEHMCSYMTTPANRCVMQTPSTRVRYDRPTLVQIGGMITMNGILQGNDQNRFYHPGRNSWFRLGCLGTMQSPWSHHKAVVVDGHIILCGGMSYPSHWGTFHDDSSTTNEVKTIDPSHMAQWDLPSMQFERAYHAVAYLKGFLYAIGGRNGTVQLSSVECLDIMNSEWTLRARLPFPREKHAAAACNNKVYVTGGLEVLSNDVDTLVNKLDCYCPDLNTWSSLTPMLTARRSHTMSAHNGRLFVCGGRANVCSVRSTECLDSVEVYNVESGQWTAVRSMPFGIAHMTDTVMDGKIMLTGGEDSAGDMISTILQYDPDTDEWSTYGNLWWPIRSLCCCAVKVKLSDDPDDMGDPVDNQDEDNLHDLLEEWGGGVFFVSSSTASRNKLFNLQIILSRRNLAKGCTGGNGTVYRVTVHLNVNAGEF